MRRAVTVRVDVHGVGVVVVSGSIRVGNISVILIRRIRVIAMAGIQMIYVGHIQVVVVRGGIAVVVVIAMAHIPVVRVRWLLNRAIQMARAGEVVVISVGGGVAVIPMERIIEVIGMPGVGVVIETSHRHARRCDRHDRRGCPHDCRDASPHRMVAVCGVSACGTSVCGGVSVCGTSVCGRYAGCRRAVYVGVRRVGMRHVGVRRRVRASMRRRIRVRGVDVVAVVAVWPSRIEMDVGVNVGVVHMR